MHTYEIHAMRHPPMRCMLVRCTLVRCTPMRYTPMRHTSIRCTPIRCTPVRYTATAVWLFQRTLKANLALYPGSPLSGHHHGLESGTEEVGRCSSLSYLAHLSCYP